MNAATEGSITLNKCTQDQPTSLSAYHAGKNSKYEYSVAEEQADTSDCRPLLTTKV